MLCNYRTLKHLLTLTKCVRISNNTANDTNHRLVTLFSKKYILKYIYLSIIYAAKLNQHICSTQILMFKS